MNSQALMNKAVIVMFCFTFFLSLNCEESSEETVILPIPHNLKATIINQGIDLTWELAEDLEGVVIRYKIYRATERNGDYILLGNSIRLQYFDQGVTADRTYFYLVTSGDDKENESEQSDIEQINFVVPILSVSKTLMNFGKRAVDLPLQISNTGNAILKWEAVVNQDWVTLNTKDGIIEAKQDQVINVHVDRKLSPGTYSAIITIESEESPSIVVRVTLDIPEAPKLFIAPQSITFGPNDIFQSIEIRNAGTGVFDWQIG